MRHYGIMANVSHSHLWYWNLGAKVILLKKESPTCCLVQGIDKWGELAEAWVSYKHLFNPRKCVILEKDKKNKLVFETQEQAQQAILDMISKEGIEFKWYQE